MVSSYMVSAMWRTPHRRNPLKHTHTNRLLQPAKGWRGSIYPEPKTGGCDPQKFFLQNFRFSLLRKFNTIFRSKVGLRVDQRANIVLVLRSYNLSLQLVDIVLVGLQGCFSLIIISDINNKNKKRKGVIIFILYIGRV